MVKKKTKENTATTKNMGIHRIRFAVVGNKAR